jgi:transposase InsO family protein
VSSRYEFIDAEKALYPVVKMCEWMVVSTSGFYEWRGRPSSATNSRRAELRLLIGKVFADSDDTYGYRRVHAELARLGVPVGPELVRTLMWELDLRSYDQPRVALGQTSVNIGAARRSRSRGVTSGTLPSIRAVATCATHDRTRTNGQRTGTLTLQRSHPCGAPGRIRTCAPASGGRCSIP